MSNSNSFPVLFKSDPNDSQCEWRIAYLFEKEFDTTSYLRNFNNKNIYQYDRNRKELLPLKSLFQQSTNNKSRSNFVIVDRTNIKNLNKVSMNPVKVTTREQINIGLYENSFCFVFFSVTMYLLARKNFLAQNRKVII